MKNSVAIVPHKLKCQFILLLVSHSVLRNWFIHTGSIYSSDSLFDCSLILGKGVWKLTLLVCPCLLPTRDTWDCFLITDLCGGRRTGDTLFLFFPRKNPQWSLGKYASTTPSRTVTITALAIMAAFIGSGKSPADKIYMDMNEKRT